MKRLFTCCLLVVFTLALATGVKAYGLTQVGVKATSITVKWDREDDALKYRVYVGKDSSSAKLYTTLPATATSVTIKNLKAGMERYIKVEYDYKLSFSETVFSNSAGVGYDFKTLPAKVTNVRQDRWYYWAKSFWVKWKKQDSADGYQYRVKTNTGKLKAAGFIKYNTDSLDVDKISNSTIYTVRVRAYTKVNNRTYFGAWSDACYCFTQPQISSAKISGSKLKVKWAKVGGATGYDVYVSTLPRAGYTKVASVGKNTTSATIAKLKGKSFSSKKTYYVYVVTKKKVGKKTNTSGRLYYWNTKNGTDGYF